MTTNENLSREAEMLSRVRKGMDVYDQARDRIGTVQSVYFGGAGDAATVEGIVPATGSDTVAAEDALRTSISELFDPRDEVPQEIAERLRYHGFIQVERGWFGANRYVMPNQIASVSDEGVILKTSIDATVDS